MTLLVISPDYASHLLPLATVAAAWHRAGDEVVVASGPATAPLVDGWGYRRVDLQLGRGSNPGVIRVQDQPPGEDDSLRGFFAATRAGMVDTLRYQALARSVDLLWDPVSVGRRVWDVVDRVAPTEILVDHLAFSARIALDAARIPYGDMVLGHPTALPVGDEVYGYPPFWPAAFTPDRERMAELLTLCRQVSSRFTEEWNTAAATLGSTAEPTTDAFGLSGDLLLLNYPRQLHPPARTASLPAHVFLGSTVREEPADAEVDRWLAADDRPVVYVSFGSFLSARGDVLARVVAALADMPVRVAVACGSTDPAQLGTIPSGWLVREYLPQVRILGRAAVVVTHGGNNSVTEAATAGVPMVVLPFSTDQFAGAAAVVDAGLGTALDPNTAGVGELRSAVEQLLAVGPDSPSAQLGRELRESPGPELARTHLLGARLSTPRG